MTSPLDDPAFLEKTDDEQAAACKIWLDNYEGDPRSHVCILVKAWMSRSNKITSQAKTITSQAKEITSQTQETSLFGSTWRNKTSAEKVLLCKNWLEENEGDPMCEVVNGILFQQQKLEVLRKTSASLAKLEIEQQKKIASQAKILRDRSLHNFLDNYEPMVDRTNSGFHFPHNSPPATVSPTVIEKAQLDAMENKFITKEFLEVYHILPDTDVHCESSCTYAVVPLLRAIIEGLGLAKIIGILPKRTMAGAECDLLLHYKPNLLPFAAIEIKKPPFDLADRKRLFHGDAKEGNKVAGEVWAEMNGVKLFGFDKVYGMIATYNHYQLVCTGELNEETDDLGAMEEALKKLKLNEETNNLEATEEASKTFKDEEDEVEEEPPSPQGKLLDFKEGIIYSEANKVTLFASQIIPNLDGNESNDISAKKILQLLTLFILKACTTLTKLLEAGECKESSVCKQMPCRILSSEKKNEFAFGAIPPLEHLELNEYDPNLKSIYVIHHLGSGSSGNCCLGVSERGGSSCAVKFYHEAGNQRTEYMAAEEFKNWEKIYGNEDYGPPMARKWELLVGHCLVMPYLKPVPKSERHKLLEAPAEGGKSPIEQTLRDFAAKGYSHRDIKWRHFGYWKKEIFLLDLGAVAKVKGSGIDEWVTEALDCLRTSAGESEPALPPTAASRLLQEDEHETQKTPKESPRPKYYGGVSGTGPYPAPASENLQTGKKTGKRKAPVESTTEESPAKPSASEYSTRSTTDPTGPKKATENVERRQT